MSKTVAFIYAFVVVTAVGWVVTHTTYPAFAFMFGAWGGYMMTPSADAPQSAHNRGGKSKQL